MKYRLLIFALLYSSLHMYAQEVAIWTPQEVATLREIPGRVVQSTATNFELFELQADQLANQLLTNTKQLTDLELPLPDGSLRTLQITPSRVMAPGLAARYPGIRTYRILPKGDILGGVLGWTHQGLHASLRTTEGMVYVDPYFRGETTYYSSYYAHENVDPDLLSNFRCGVTGAEVEPITFAPRPTSHQHLDTHLKDLLSDTISQHRYRLAVVAAAEYSQYHAGPDNVPTVEESLSAIVVIVNRLNEVFGVDVGTQFELVADNDQLIFFDPETDGLSLGDTRSLAYEGDGIMDRVLGPDNFDIGHSVTISPPRDQQVDGNPAGFGPGRICTAFKGAGASTTVNPVGERFTLIVAHELGHQLSALHTFSSCTTPIIPEGNLQSETAVEPGGGSTIMSYAGVCIPENTLQNRADPYFHSLNVEQMLNWTREDLGNRCGSRIYEDNSIPEISHDYENGFFIPVSTPFELVAQGSDAEEDRLTYAWEQMDINSGPAVPLGSPALNSPLFRSLLPSPNANRVFPRMNRIVENTAAEFVDEVLPDYSRDLTFRCTVRDNHPTSGGAAWTTVAFKSSDSAGPFLVQSANNPGTNWTVGDFVEVNWDVANTDNEIVNCQRVNIRMSTDGGFTYPIMLLENTANDGSAFVTVPDAVGDEVRIRIDAVDNVFFDINNADLTIIPATTPGYTVAYGPQLQQVCTLEEEAVVNFSTSAILGYADPLTFAITSELPEGVTAFFSANELSPGGSTDLVLNFEQSSFDGPLRVEVRTTAADQDTTYRDFDLDIVNTDQSSLALLTPVSGETDIVVSAPFSWTSLPAAISYDFQIATAPDFAEDQLYFAATDLTASNYLPPGLQLAENTLFFWRVRPQNECGIGQWSIPNVFQTELSSCQEVEALGLPISIPNTGPLATINSPIDVDVSGTISDVSIPLVDVRYGTQFYSLRLISPAETEVLLYENGFCFDGTRLNIGFDSESPIPLNCEEGNEPMLSDRTSRQPIESLDAFNGENTAGTWNLELKVAQPGFSSGSLEQWSIQFCAALDALELALLNNDTLFVPPGQSNPVSNDLLRIADAGQSLAPEEIIYTLVAVPQHGILTNFAGETLVVGSTFTQLSIDANNIRYTNTGDVAEDAFYFVALDGNGAFWPTERFVIAIDDGAVVDTDELSLPAQDLRLFPNPTTGITTLQLNAPLDYDLPLRVYDLQGRLLQQSILSQGSLQQQLNVSNWPSGAYVLRAGQQSLRLLVNGYK